MVQMVPDSALCIYLKEVPSSRKPLKCLMTSSALTLNIRFISFLNLQEALSEQLGENRGFPQDRALSVFVFPLSVLAHVHADKTVP